MALLGRGISLLVAAAIAVATIAWVLSEAGPLSTFRESVGLERRGEIGQPRRGADEGATRAARERTAGESSLASTRARGGELLAQARSLALAGFALAVLLAAALWGARIGSRKRQPMARLRIVPGRTDEASPAEVRALLETWHAQLLRRPWRRIACGQPPVCLELHCVPEATGSELTLSLVAPEELAGGLEAALRATYPDTRLEPGAWVPSHDVILRLRKRYPLERALAAPERPEDTAQEALLGVMQSAEGPVSVQYALVPGSPMLDLFARSVIRARERSHERARMRERGDPGLRSEVAARELRSGSEALGGRALFAGDLRIGAAEVRTARLAAGAIIGASAAENRLTARRERVSRRLHARRMARGEADRFPSPLRGVYSSAELAGLWALPSPYAKGLRIERSALPRIDAPRGVERPAQEHALMRDGLGALALPAEAKPLGTMLLGVPGTGKSSLIARSVADDAADENCAVIVIDGKNETAEASLSVLEEGFQRRVHVLDFAHPEVGYNPFAALASVDRYALTDSIAESLKAIHLEGSIQASSDRYIRQAALAVLGWAERTKPEGGPTFYDMWDLLLPSSAEFRQAVVEAIEPEPELSAVTKFFAEQLPDQLKSALSMMTTRLDAPVNKIQALTGQPALDSILRHPVSLDIDEIIRRREVLVVAGSVAEFGEGTAQALLQLLLHAIHTALGRQRSLPEDRRARVALKVDEAHYLFSPTYAKMLAMGRSAGLECMSAFQSLAQVKEPDLRQEVLDLHANKLVFRVGSSDARELSETLQQAYADSVRDDAESRARMRIAPDALINLPSWHAACSLVAKGERMPAFVAETIAMQRLPGRIERHLEAQRARGAHHPGILAQPRRLPAGRKVAELPSDSDNGARRDGDTAPESADRQATNGARRNGDGARSPQDTNGQPANGPVPEWEPERSSLDTSGDRTGAAPVGEDTGAPLPDSYTELDLADPTGIRWDATPPDLPKGKKPRPDELRVLAALYELRYLFVSQVARRYMADRSLNAAQRRLTQMFHAGWVARFKVTTRKRGAAKWVYTLTERGFKLAQGHTGRDGSLIDPEARWREPELRDHALVLHDLHAAAWLFAFEAKAGPFVRGWRGQRGAQLNPPTIKERGGPWRRKRADELAPGAGQRVRDLAAEELEAVRPDLAIELRLLDKGRPRRLDLLLELDRTRRPSANLDKLRRYDALITGWALELERYKLLGEPPIVVFACEDGERARKLAEAADPVVTGAIATAGLAEAEWSWLGRKRMFFAAERDLHQGTLRMLKLPEWPPALRRRAEHRGGKHRRAQVEFTQRGLLGSDELVRKAAVLMAGGG